MAKPRIAKSNSPEVMAISARPQGSAQAKARELALEAKNGGDGDWSKWIGATGGGLLGYSIMSSILDKTDDEKRKESVWMRVLRELANLGVGAAGAYGGYLLGKNAAATTNATKAVSAPVVGKPADPLWDPKGNKWVLQEDATGSGPYVDLFGEKRDAASAWKWPWWITGGAEGVGSGVAGWQAGRRFIDYLHGEPQPRGKNGVVPTQLPRVQQLQEAVRKAEEAIKTDSANATAHAEAVRRIGDENAQARAEHDANATAKRNAYNDEMAIYNKRLSEYDTRVKAWENGGRKGKPPTPPVQPKAPVIPDFVPKNNPTPPPSSGVTQANVDAARAALKRDMGRRALRWGGASTGLGFLSLLSLLRANHNQEEEARVDARLREAGVDPSAVNLD